MTPLRGDSATIISKLYMKLVMASAPDRMLSRTKQISQADRGTASGTHCQTSEWRIRSSITLFWPSFKFIRSEY